MCAGRRKITSFPKPPPRNTGFRFSLHAATLSSTISMRYPVATQTSICMTEISNPRDRVSKQIQNRDRNGEAYQGSKSGLFRGHEGCAPLLPKHQSTVRGQSESVPARIQLMSFLSKVSVIVSPFDIDLHGCGLRAESEMQIRAAFA